MNRRAAFTYIELTIVTVVVAILFLAAMPDGDTVANQQGLEFVHRFEGDVAYARSMSVAQPADPVVIKVDGTNNRYWLARASAPDTPILHPNTHQPFLVQAGPGGDRGFEYVQISGIDFDGDDILGFDSTGSTDQDTTAVMQVVSGSSSYESTVDSQSGGTTSQEGYSFSLGGGGGGTSFQFSNTIQQNQNLGGGGGVVN